jgi:hypothetical protein
MSTMSRARAVGRRFSQRQRTYVPATRGYVESLDPRNFPDVDATIEASLSELEAAGIPARSLVAQREDGWFVVERVIHVEGNEPDSRLGLLAQIVHHACALRAWAAAMPGNEGACARRVSHAYALGRAATLADAYAIDDARHGRFRLGGADKVRKYNDVDRARWRELRNTKFAHHSEKRASELIAKECNLPESAAASVRAELQKKAAKPL